MNHMQQPQLGQQSASMPGPQHTQEQSPPRIVRAKTHIVLLTEEQQKQKHQQVMHQINKQASDRLEQQKQQQQQQQRQSLPPARNMARSESTPEPQPKHGRAKTTQMSRTNNAFTSTTSRNYNYNPPQQNAIKPVVSKPPISNASSAQSSHHSRQTSNASSVGSTPHTTVTSSARGSVTSVSSDATSGSAFGGGGGGGVGGETSSPPSQLPRSPTADSTTSTEANVTLDTTAPVKKVHVALMKFDPTKSDVEVWQIILKLPTEAVQKELKYEIIKCCRILF